MSAVTFDSLRETIRAIEPVRHFARVIEVGRGIVRLAGAEGDWSFGDRVEGQSRSGPWTGEVIALEQRRVLVMADVLPDGIALGDRVERLGSFDLSPDNSWIGRVIDPLGRPLDGQPLHRGAQARPLRCPPPAPGRRRRFGVRLETGTAAFDTLLPLVQGQRIGLFAGSGVGKSTLIGKLARGVRSDVTVIALVGERGRELRDFIEVVLGPEGMAQSVIVAATSDQSPLTRRRCAWAAMAVAEHFRDQGMQVLFIADSITRLAEAHREVALAAGEPATLRGFPPSTSHLIMALSERAGPGEGTQGDITAILSVLVAGSDMEEPIADILRGVLDGHVVMDRRIAERGRYPAIDLLRSVSRSLPGAGSPEENRLIGKARQLLGAYERAELMVQAGLYTPGSDALIDEAIAVHAALDGFIAEDAPDGIRQAFARLGSILEPG